MTPAQAKRQRAALMRDVAREIKRGNRKKLVALRDRLHVAKAERRAAHRQALGACRAARAPLPTVKQLAAELRAAKAEAKGVCDAEMASARTLRGKVSKARAELASEKKYQREIKRIEAGNRRKWKDAPGLARARTSQSDDEVRQNIPPELVALFERVKRSIKGSDRKTRTEAFLEYAEEHPDEEWAALEGSVDRAIEEMERRQAMPNPKKKKRKSANAVAFDAGFDAGLSDGQIGNRDATNEALRMGARVQRREARNEYPLDKFTEGYMAGYRRGSGARKAKKRKNPELSIDPPRARRRRKKKPAPPPATIVVKTNKGRRRAKKKNAPALSAKQSRARFRALKKAGCEPKRVRVAGGSVVVRKKGCKPPPMPNSGRWFDRVLASPLGRKHARDRMRADLSASWYRQSPVMRARRVATLCRGTSKEKRAAVAIAKAEQAHADGPRRRKNPGMTDGDAVREYERTHWGERGRARASRASAPDPRHGTATKLGELVAVVYRTKKGGDDGLTDYEHAFEGKRPTLVYNDGGLMVAGGDYVIREEGIEG